VAVVSEVVLAQDARVLVEVVQAVEVEVQERQQAVEPAGGF
jgi:hypothetical protein